MRRSLFAWVALSAIFAGGWVQAASEPETATVRPSTATLSSRTLVRPELLTDRPATTARIADREILVLGELSASSVAAAAQPALRLPPQTIYAERVDRSEPSRIQDPLRFRFVLPSGDELDVEPSFRVLEAIRFDPQTDRFRGRIGLGVLSRTRPQDTSPIDPPVRFTVSGPGLSLDPVQIPVGHLNQPLEEIDVSYSEPRAEVELQLVSSFDPQAPLRRRVEAELPRLELFTSRPSADGFGLGTISVSVAAAAGPSFAGRRVSLRTTGGYLDQSEVTLDDQGRGETTLRSSFVGAASISARGYPFSPPTPVDVRFAMPLALLGALVAGALAGAAARHFFTRERWRRFAGGMLAGIVGGVLAVLGVNVLAIAVHVPAGEAFVFVIAALSAYLGPALFDRVLGGASPPAATT
ncbi:MAG: hypothetical protein V2J24_05560 [Pseudomonadales bacterium]|jgi:uncharacterized membrane protein YeaQ/YmgE (transglycosylase-associated protein family)|nr:hypothetical protein [Pseudomonadales bacterium]